MGVTAAHAAASLSGDGWEIAYQRNIRESEREIIVSSMFDNGVRVWHTAYSCVCVCVCVYA